MAGEHLRQRQMQLPVMYLKQAIESDQVLGWHGAGSLPAVECFHEHHYHAIPTQDL
jgi:hypothetical protein